MGPSSSCRGETGAYHLGFSSLMLRKNVLSSMESKISLPVQTLMASVIAKLIHQSLKQWTPVHFSLKNPTKQKPYLKDIYLKA